MELGRKYLSLSPSLVASENNDKKKERWECAKKSVVCSVDVRPSDGRLQSAKELRKVCVSFLKKKTKRKLNLVKEDEKKVRSDTLSVRSVYLRLEDVYCSDGL